MSNLKFFRIALSLLFVFMTTAISAQTVKGTVKDSNGEPVIGATVMEKGTKNGTTTDLNGNFSINLKGNNPLMVSYVGMASQQVSVAGKSSVSVVMQEDAHSLDDVVVIGYGVVKKRDLTGAIASVKSDDITKTPTTNVMEAIQGQVAGFDITRSNGEVGADMKMTLRGNRSIFGNNEPLFIIDGMEGKFSELNPNDIASIEVLKDASSTAIYGAAGANGVVIITTKNAKKGEFKINFDAYLGWNKVTSFPELLTGQDYINFRQEAMNTAGLSGDLFPSSYQSLIDEGKWTNWYKEGTQTGMIQDYNLSTSYATDRMNSFFSLNYSDTKGTLKGDELKRYALRAKMDFHANKIVDYGFNVYAAYSDNDKRNSRFWNRVMCTVPLGDPYDENGNVNKYPINGETSYISPIIDTQTDQYVNKVRTISVNPQAYVQISPLKGLSFKSVLGGYFANKKQGIYAGSNSWDGQQTGSYASIPNTLTYNYKWQNILNYLWDINDDHTLTFTGVTEWSKNTTEGVTARADGFDVDTYAYNNLGAGATAKVASDFTQTQMMSYVLRANYSYKGRYIVSVSNRWDGSSTLAAGKKWDSFPAASVAWRLSDESFMKWSEDWLTNAKIRAGYGVTGNAGIGAYGTQAYSRTGLIGFQDVSSQYSGYDTYIANPNLGWEKTYSWNVGLDLSLFNNRVDLSLDWYTAHTKDLLFERSLPYEAGGFASGTFKIWQNIGETKNSGIELAINSRNIVGKDFNWNTSFTMAYNKERVVKTTSDNPLVNGDYYLIEDQPVNTYYMYKYVGIWKQSEAEEAAKYGQKPGQIHVLDADSNEKLNTDDYQVIGHADPDWTLGMVNSFNYKNFDLSFQLIGRFGHTLMYGITGWYRLDGINPTPAVCDYYTADNENARFPQPNASGSQDAYQANSSLNYFSGSYIKLKNVTFGYTLPQNITKAIKMSRARIYFTTANPFVWCNSKYIKNYDPEKGGDDDDAPLSKQFVFGVNLTF